jgi:antitoxin ParD1/3/4
MGLLYTKVRHLEERKKRKNYFRFWNFDFGFDRVDLQVVHIWCTFVSKYNTMARQSISFTKPNEEWLKVQVNNEEYTSKSELINDLIRQARKQQVQVDFIRAKLDKSERSGFTDDTKELILKQSKSLLNGQI